MPLGLVSYGDSDDDSGDESKATESVSAGNAPASVPKKPLFPVSSGSAVGPSKVSAYSKLGLERDESGRVKIAAPRYDHPDSDEEDDQRKQLKKQKTAAGIGGLFSMLPEPQGPVKKSEIVAQRSSELDELFAAKKKSSDGVIRETVNVPSVNTLRYQAEQKKMATINKFLKKDVDDGPSNPPQKPTHNSQPQVDQSEEDVEWEVDESAYDDEQPSSSFQHNLPTDSFDPLHPPQPSLQPGSVWTANYKYEDVQSLMETPVLPPGYKTDQQVHQMISKYEGAEFQEYLSQGNQIQIIDFNADEHLGDARVNVMRSLTEQGSGLPPRTAPPVKGKVSKVSKQKGHITYLAQQAIAREQELQNEWAKGRINRKQSAMKYGF